MATFLPPSSHFYANVSNQILKTEINKLLQEEPILKGGLTGISIRTASTGEVLYEHNGDVRMRPASNMKLFTSAAALSVLGEKYQFRTEIRMDGKRDGNILKGNLYLKGFGDPTLLGEDLDQLTKFIAHSNGITSIEGDLIGDDSWYDDVRLSRDLNWSDESAYYGSQISALTVSPTKDFDSGTIIVEAFPGLNIGNPVQIKLSQNTNYVNVINQAVTVSPDGETDLSIDRKHGSNTIIVKGFLPIGAKKEKEWIAIWEPTQFVLDFFNQKLAKEGIKLSGNSKLGVTPKDAKILTSHLSIPLSELLIPFMKLSNNGHAEILVKEMGKIRKGEGSWEKGLEVINEQLYKLGVNPETLVIRDGSGISHVNLVPANEISKLLFNVQKEKWFPTFLISLPVAGDSNRMVGGTLRKRMESLNVKAKTGTISTVSSLSGYVETQKGEILIFSILLNNLLDEEKGKDIEDKIVKIIAKHK
ncbi:D-alanyl-D-alanine carboxypeptidase/D-alanyl-D-alanine-endopeptidase [Neobacillus sp. YX16]|uniref:D-alanyl-D-alanine carboxypeptidase/D-alanyl-D-alanine endopeptidase n=1 Tax=Neobacillus sp. YX16 TaxID=3047874 RepID=UPI0024C2FB0E|nr:D-alanyl-D-alanine carboxypeptidase/D-alanyl-D-alanine-endopeptidase [Neobacillus sp. YX16]WHZ01131.1 D-alanyl-D-alanine carboxypeptidase/D-alanyl-D-alanine-endopeptidase [Neobacillus sp. YX16]